MNKKDKAFIIRTCTNVSTFTMYGIGGFFILEQANTNTPIGTMYLLLGLASFLYYFYKIGQCNNQANNLILQHETEPPSEENNAR